MPQLGGQGVAVKHRAGDHRAQRDELADVVGISAVEFAVDQHGKHAHKTADGGVERESASREVQILAHRLDKNAKAVDKDAGCSRHQQRAAQHDDPAVKQFALLFCRRAGGFFHS